ncbi:hypothetical protein [Lysobacter sp. M2-1]|uniref:hypothetical protein n=1 Tax=Lysobacter sp. M2-1 TaxID=2916839 RepID=UPI001F597D72|nr:hypothetical protein [Lysobacter sp. M2-1]
MDLFAKHRNSSSQRLLIAVLVAWLLAACKASAPAADAPGAAPAEPAASVPVAAAVACPSQEFDQFLQAFMRDVAVQRAYTRDPYALTLYDPQNLEADPTTMQLAAGEVTFPVMLTADELERQGVVWEVERKAQDAYVVSAHSQGSGAYAVAFTFKRGAGCWELAGAVDAST